MSEREKKNLTTKRADRAKQQKIENKTDKLQSFSEYKPAAESE
jgi:hypothetical protein